MVSAVSFYHSPFFYNNAPSKVKRIFQPLLYIKQTAGYEWERLKACFTSLSPSILRIQALLENLPEDFNEETLEFLGTRLVTASPFSREGHLLKTFIRECSPEQEQLIFEKAFSCLIANDHYNFDTLFPFFSENFDREVFQSELEISEKVLGDFKTMRPHPLQSELVKTLKAGLQFFRTVIDTTLIAFNFIKIGKPPETIWDFAAMMAIYFKMFSIPFGIFFILSPLAATGVQALGATALTVLALIIGAGLYLKYRPCPSTLPYCENLSEQAALGKLEPVVSRDALIQEISAYLGNPGENTLTNLLLVGPSGVGKTELAKGLALQDDRKVIFSVNTSNLSNGYVSPSLRLELLLANVAGHEDKVTFFFDELGEAKESIGRCLKVPLSRGGIQVIAALTEEEYFEHIVPDEAFASRFHVIHVDPTTEEETLAIINTRLSCKGNGIRHSDGIAEEVFALTKDLQLPRHPIKLIDLAINKVSAYNIDAYQSDQLLALKNRLDRKKLEYRNAWKRQDLEHKENLHEEIQQISANIEELETENLSVIKEAKRVKHLIAVQNYLFQYACSHIKTPEATSTLYYIEKILLPWIEKTIQEKIQEVPEEIPMMIDQPLLEKIQQEWESEKEKTE